MMAQDGRVRGASARLAAHPRSLQVLFDPSCALCRRCVHWMQHQASYVQLGFLACTGAEARARYGDIPWLGDELVVVSDAGEVWVGPAGLQGRHLLVGPVSAPCPKPRR